VLLQDAGEQTERSHSNRLQSQYHRIFQEQGVVRSLCQALMLRREAIKNCVSLDYFVKMRLFMPYANMVLLKGYMDQ